MEKERTVPPKSGILKERTSPISTYPLVLIAGRPNVGKSTLWNALLGKREAIVHDMPGVTRDILSRITRIGRGFVELADTGGLLPEHGKPEDFLRILASEKVKRWILQADLILFVVDVQEGILPADVEIFLWIRQQNPHIILVANKADDIHWERPEWIAELPVPEDVPVVFVSARNRRNLHSLRQKIEQQLIQKLGEETYFQKASQPPSLPPEKPWSPEELTALRIAIVGKPNVGKSTLLNQWVGTERVLVSEIPGTTRDAVEIPIRYYGKTLWLVDTAGLRRPARVNSPLEAYSITRVVEAIERSHVVVLLMNAEEPATHQDLKIFRTILNRLRAVVVGLNRWDRVQHLAPREQNAIREYVRTRLAPFSDVPIVTLSALTGKRVFSLLEEVYHTGRRFFQRIPTGPLNRWIQQVVKEKPPPMYGGKPIRFRYCTQSGIAPPEFVFFVSAPEGISTAYARFLEKQLRSRWDWSGVPFRMIFRTTGEEGQKERRKEFQSGR